MARARRRRRRMDWVVGLWSEGTVVVPGGDDVVILDLLSPQDLEDKGDNLTVLRVVGNFEWYIATGQSTELSALPSDRRVWMRLETMDERHEPAGTIVGSDDLFYMPSRVDNADDSFMWGRNFVFDSGVVNATNGSLVPGDITVGAHPWWSTMDVKVKRRLRDEMRLTLVLENRLRDLAGLPVTANFYGYIRVLVAY